MLHETIIKVENLKKDFDLGKSKYPAIKGISLEIQATDFVIIYGPSGCGKSTLLNSITGLERPTFGRVTIRNNDIYQMEENDRSRFRAGKFGIVFQQPLWIKALDLVHNVAMPLLINGEKENRACEKAIDVLKEVEMASFARHKLAELSGGQQQRAGIARALIHNPWILIADEPTGNLDTHAADEVMHIFQKLNVVHKRTIIMVTHNLIYLPLATRKIAMKDGMISQGENEVKELVRDEYESVFGKGTK